MPGYIGLQLAVELSSLFPKELATTGVTKLVNFARELRKAGSDIVVEEDLAEIFGRGRVSANLEKQFKAQVQIQRFTPLYHGSEVVLVEGTGPTMLRAFRESKYFSTVLTLSMLGYFHGRENLASLISQSITLRFEAKIAGASSDPGYEGISSTLMACSTQSAAFQWSTYRHLVEEKLRLSIPNYHFSADYIRLTPALFLGAMDFLYFVQSLPEDRKITVSDETGCITLVIWAHYILELNVVITNIPKGQIVFGNAEEAQVYITWSQEKKEDAGELFWPSDSDTDGPIIRLHEKDMSVILTCAPQAEERLVISAEERHPLEGYGLTYLRRILNVDVITLDDDPVYQESVKLIVGLAVHASRRLDRDLNFTARGLDQSNQRSGAAINIEAWRVLKSARLIFAGIEVDSVGVDSYANFLAHAKLDISSLPNSFTSFLKKVKQGTSSFPPAYRLLEQVKHLAKIVLIFAHVVELEDCGDMPLILTNDHVQFSSVMSQILQGPDHRGLVEPSEIFHAVTTLLSSSVLDNRDDMPKWSSRISHFLFLCSDFGWSVFLDTAGDKDPAKTRPELIHVQRGTPTNKRTQERKSRIRDGTGFTTKEYPDNNPVQRGNEYVPRAAARVSRRTEYWTTQSKEFELTLYFLVDPSPEWRKYEGVEPFEETTSYRAMQHSLWQTFTTPPCGHHPVQEIYNTRHAVKLGPDAATLLGWSNALESLGSPYPERILIYLTLGQHRVRWLAIEKSVLGRHVDDKHRETMLRTDDCCEECALDQVASLPGRWVLIL